MRAAGRPGGGVDGGEGERIESSLHLSVSLAAAPC